MAKYFIFSLFCFNICVVNVWVCGMNWSKTDPAVITLTCHCHYPPAPFGLINHYTVCLTGQKVLKEKLSLHLTACGGALTSTCIALLPKREEEHLACRDFTQSGNCKHVRNNNKFWKTRLNVVLAVYISIMNFHPLKSVILSKVITASFVSKLFQLPLQEG